MFFHNGSFFEKLILFIHLWLHWVFVLRTGFPLVAPRGVFVAEHSGFSLLWLRPGAELGILVHGSVVRGTWTLPGPSIGRQKLTHCGTRKILRRPLCDPLPTVTTCCSLGWSLQAAVCERVVWSRMGHTHLLRPGGLPCDPCLVVVGLSLY